MRQRHETFCDRNLVLGPRQRSQPHAAGDDGGMDGREPHHHYAVIPALAGVRIPVKAATVYV